MHVAVKEVTSPVHDASGMAVVFRPGEQFPADKMLPEGVPWRWAVGVVPDAAPETSGTAGDGSSAGGVHAEPAKDSSVYPPRAQPRAAKK